MNVLHFIVLFVLILCFFSCNKSNTNVVTSYASFNIALLDRAPDAQVGINNTTLIGNSYHWTYTTDYFTSTFAKKWPNTILIKTPGPLTITLVDSVGKGIQSVTQTYNITGYDSVLSYHNITFGLHAGDSIYGRYFSTRAGIMYKDNEINATTAPLIDLIFYSWGDTLFSLLDTINSKYLSIGTSFYDSIGKNTLSFVGIDSIVNNVYYYPKPTYITFDSIVYDRFFYRTSMMTGSDKRIPLKSMLNTLILFRNSSSRSGVIRPTYMDANKITVDIKMQKY